MFRFLSLSLFLALAVPASAQVPSKWVLVMHGGAGRLPPDLPANELTLMRTTLARALETAGQQLASGASSLDAVETAVRIMEESCAYNAGCGAVLDHDGNAVLDASIMNGNGKTAGAVAGTRRIAHPIMLARLVMEKSPHVMLIGDGAEAFAKSQGIGFKPPAYFITPRRKAEWQRALESETLPATSSRGTVGAVALDVNGNLAAATSTGGMTNKRVGRIGDSPVIGAGTYAENGTCAVSATGAGEFFIRYTAAADICARVRYKGESIATAAETVIEGLRQAGGTGGVIALDGAGNIATPYSTATMTRGTISAGKGAEIALGVGP